MNLDRVLATLKQEGIVEKDIRMEGIEWGRPKKSAECLDGYRGRIGIHEVLEMSDTVRQLVMKSATADEIEKTAQREGMLAMREEGFIRAAQHISSLEEIFRVTSE